MTIGATCRRALAAVLPVLIASRVAAMSAVSLLDMLEPIRSASVGGGGVALGSDSTLAPVNPAATARLDHPTLTLGGQRGLFNDLFGNAAVTRPTERGTWFAGLSYYESAGATIRSPDNSLHSFRLQQDLVAAAGYARTLTPDVAWGVAVKVLRTELFDEFRAQAGALDLGVQVRVNNHLKVGAAIRNLGSRYRYFEDALSPRTETRLGVAGGWRVREGGAGSPGDSLILIADGVWDAALGSLALCTGAEYRWMGCPPWRGPRLLERILPAGLRDPVRFRLRHAPRPRPHGHVLGSG
jgi:hypothetical protein